MVHSWNYALAVLLATSAATPVTSFQSSSSRCQTNHIHNSITQNHVPSRRRQRLPTTKETTITATKASLTSMAADASYNDNDTNVVGDALSSVTNAAVDFVKDEPDTDAEEVARKKEMVQKRQTEKVFQVTLPLTSPSAIGISVCELNLDAPLELNLDTLELENVSNREQNDIEIAKIQRRIYGEFTGLVVSSVREDSAAWEAGVRPGDILKRTSATLGKQMWPKSTLEGVKSAVSSRNAVAESMEFEFQRLVETVDNQFELTLTRPIGFNLKGKQKMELTLENIVSTKTWRLMILLFFVLNFCRNGRRICGGHGLYTQGFQASSGCGPTRRSNCGRRRVPGRAHVARIHY